MEWDADTQTRWQQSAENTLQFDLALDLRSRGLIESEKEFSRNRMAVRERVFRSVTDALVPALARDLGSPIEPPAQWHVQSNSSYENRLTLSSPSLEGGAILSQLRLRFEFVASEAMNPATILYLGRDQVAITITDGILHGLEHRLEGQENTEVETSVERKEDAVSYRAIDGSSSVH